jgi:acyl-coenzyme A thioesterase PaaI-like protein
MPAEGQLTHLAIAPQWSGTPVALKPGHAQVILSTTPEMAADARGLVHGGFVFGLADYAAMLAINDPNVVLGAADFRFLKPVAVGDVLLADARLESELGKKRLVRIEVRRGDTAVLIGTCTCFVPEHHVLDTAPGAGSTPAAAR